MRKTILSGDNLLKRKEDKRKKMCIYVALAVIIAVAILMIAVTSVQ
jgi:hypothetical protein